MTEMLSKVRPADLRPGDLLDLEGDRYADPANDDTILAFEYAEVDEVRRETADCIVVSTNHVAFGCPPTHEIKTLRELPTVEHDRGENI